MNDMPPTAERSVFDLGPVNLTPFTSPPSLSNSAKGENSYAHQNDLELGVALVDRFTDATCDYIHHLADRVAPRRPERAQQPPQLLPRVREYFEQVRGDWRGPTSFHPSLTFDQTHHPWITQVPLARLLESYQPTQIKSNPVVRKDLYGGTPLPSMAAFFSDAARVRVLPMPPPAPRVVQEGGGRKPGEGRHRQDQQPPWARFVAAAESCHQYDHDAGEEEDGGHGQRRQRPTPWGWVGLGLVGYVGLKGLGGGGAGEEEEEEEDAKGRRRG